MYAWCVLILCSMDQCEIICIFSYKSIFISIFHTNLHLNTMGRWDVGMDLHMYAASEKLHEIAEVSMAT